MTEASPDPLVGLLAPSAETIDGVYTLYARLRSETPVRCHRHADGTADWHVTRYAEIAALLRDPRLSVRIGGGERQAALIASLPEPARSQREAMQRHMDSMLRQDDPDHARVRSLVHRAFTPRIVAAMRARIQVRVDALLDVALARGTMDVIRDLAAPLPAAVIADLLGVPESDAPAFRAWSADLAAFQGGTEGLAAAARSKAAMVAYLRDRIAHCRSRPGDDLLSGLVHAADAGDRLSEEELIANALLLLFAGHETTTNLIGNGLPALLGHPDQLRRLQENPGMMDTAVEELLRFDSPVQVVARIAREDVPLDGDTVRRGQLVLLWLGAANRDPAQFTDPDRLDIARRENRHVAFGHGVHYCLGAALARLEGQIAVGSLLAHAPSIRRTEAAPIWRVNRNLRGLATLPIAWHTATR